METQSSAAPVRRFTCPKNPAHDQFYLRRHYSEAFVVSADGRVAETETSNSFDGEGDGPVNCTPCWQEDHAVVEAVDARPGDDLREDASL